MQSGGPGRSARLFIPIQKRPYCPSTVSSLVQCGHRVASIAISDLQKGHSLVVGVGGVTTIFFSVISLNLFIALTMKKMTSEMRKKSMTAPRNRPILMVGAPAAWAASNVGYLVRPRLM